MNLKNAASWAEIISALAIVLSLVYVAIQVTDNTIATRTATASQASTVITDWYEHLSSDAELVDIWYSGIREPENLTEKEFLRFTFLVHIYMLQIQNNFYLVQEGTLEDKVLSSIALNMTVVKGSPGFDKYWKLRKKLFYKEFNMYIEELMFRSDYEANPVYKVNKQK
jgi:hypothetical protein